MAIRETVSIPVIAVGKLGYPKIAEEVLRTGKADFVSLGRQLLADPEWPLKVKEGRINDIRWCLGCHEGCLRRILDGKYLSCAVNPATGMENGLSLSHASKRKTVLVVGGGPGGMEAARIAALRGHDVTLWERKDRLGGNLIPAGIPEFKRDYGAFLEYLTSQVRKLRVNIELMKDATLDLIHEVSPDEIIVATGATPLAPEVPGISGSKVVTAIDVLLGKENLGKEIVVIGGGHVGCETALWLAQKGKRVIVLEILADILQDLFPVNRMMLIKMLDEEGVRVLSSANISEINSEGLLVQREGEVQALRADTIVLAEGMKPERRLLENIEGRLSTVHAIGDCVKPRKMINAIWEAYNMARLI